jgi:bla regulator protein blaR1
MPMKFPTLWMILLAAVPGSVLQAQNLTGTWQGSLQGPQGPALRVVMKITRAPDESLKAVLYSIDQGGTPLNATSVSQQGSTVKIALPAIGGTYEGKVSADGNSIAGAWSQGPAPAPLNLTRATPETAWVIPEPPPPLKAMAANADPGIEVATIKPSRPDEAFSLGAGRAGVFTTTATPLRTLIQFANGIHPRQISNGPSWMDSDRYDVTIKPDQDGIPTIPQMRVLVRKLLADRFNLVSHREKKQLSVYAITAAKGGPKLIPHEGPASNQPSFGFGRGMLNIRNTTMTEFAGFLQANILEQPVVDETGLTDRFDFNVRYTPDAAQLANLPAGVPPPPPINDDSPPDLFTAFQQQIGLKLEPKKALVDVVVVDSVERPSDN